jgi:hypothetical protein
VCLLRDFEIEIKAEAASKHVPAVAEAVRLLTSKLKQPIRIIGDQHEYRLSMEDILCGYYSFFDETVLWVVEECRKHLGPADPKELLLPEADPKELLLPEADPKELSLLEEAVGVLSNPDKTNLVIARMIEWWMRPISISFRVDQPCLAARLTTLYKKSHGKNVLLTEVRQLDPKPNDVVDHGRHWKAYHSVRSQWPTGFENTSWNCEKLGIDGPRRELPVLVTKHAITRLYERLPLRHYINLHRLMTLSLHEPVVHPADKPATCLVEAVLGSYKLGYFVAKILPQCVLVRTFLFLTMKGTPEYRKLSEVLGLHRNDIEYYRLDSLHTLAYSDIATDPLLARIPTHYFRPNTSA